MAAERANEMHAVCPYAFECRRRVMSDFALKGHGNHIVDVGSMDAGSQVEYIVRPLGRWRSVGLLTS